MSFTIGENQKPPYAKIWKIDRKENYSLVQISTGRKKAKDSTEYVNSSWYARFVGKAHEKAKKLEGSERIVILFGRVDNEPYEKDGEKRYPKTANVTVFDFELADAKRPKSNDWDQAPTVNDSDNSEDLPF
jgi:hypothetical protein